MYIKFINVVLITIILSLQLCMSASININNKDIAFDFNNFDLNVRPQDDFFNFVNGGWVKKTNIPQNKPNWNTFNEIRELTENNSLNILKNLLKKKIINNEQRNIKILFKSFIDVESRNTKSLLSIQKELSDIDNIKSLLDLQNYITKKIKSGQSNPFINFEIDADFKNSNQNAIYLTSANTLLPRDYFQKKSKFNKTVILEYTNFINKILNLLNLTNSIKKSKNIVNFEKTISNYLLSIEKIRDPYLQYNPIEIKNYKKVKNINIAQILHDCGIDYDKIIISEINYYNNLDKLLNLKNLSLIKDYLKFYILVENSDFLDEYLTMLHFNFYKKFLKGQQQIDSIEKRGLNLVNNHLGESFGKLYVEKYFSQKSKQQVLDIVDYLIKSFAIHIKDLNWMSSITKDHALKKLYSLKIKIGYPDKWKDYSTLNITDNEKDLISIINKIKLYKYNQQLEDLKKNFDKDKWDMYPQTVNAYYNPLNNEIVFPAAILQTPFFNHKADAAVNFGAIGAIIGHEITHGFDDSGSSFDKNGNLNNWWTKKDKKNFELIIKKLETRFNKYEILPGNFINGKFTLGENIADLGGVNIAFDALQLYLKDKKSSNKDINNLSQNQRFFISWTTIWRNKATEEFLKNQIKIDPHAPDYFRSFAPLINIDSFYKEFYLRPSDKLYLEPNKRIKIW